MHADDTDDFVLGVLGQKHDGAAASSADSSVLSRRGRRAQRSVASSSAAASVDVPPVDGARLQVPLVDVPPVPSDTTVDGAVLQMLVAKRPRVEPKKVAYAQRSDQLLQHARDQRGVQLEKRKTESANSKRAKSERDVDTLVSLAPSLASVIGRRPRRRTLTERTEAAQRLSVMPQVHRDDAIALAQRRAQVVTSSAIHTA